MLEKEPGSPITVQGRFHCPNSVPYGVSGHIGICSFPYNHKEKTTLCGLCFCSSGCLPSVRIRILRQGHKPLLFGVFTTFLGTSRHFCDATEKHPWCGRGASACQREGGLTSNWQLSCRQPTPLAASLPHLGFLREFIALADHSTISFHSYFKNNTSHLSLEIMSKDSVS